LARIEVARQAIQHLPVTPAVIAGLRESAKLFSTHYSTMIEGNLLTQEQVSQVVEDKQHFPGRERDEKEVLGYYAALEKLEQFVAAASTVAPRTAVPSIPATVTETQIQTLHALVMAGGRKKAKPTPYRDGQNVIRDGRSRGIVYMPPEAKDVPLLMKEMVAWVETTHLRAARFGGQAPKKELPCPIRAGIVHYQFATIHPYYDGNGRTARLLTTLVLHLGGYDLKGLYSLEEYYARHLGAYYEALSIGPSHNYYEGRAKADITKWVEYFCAGMVDSFESVVRRTQEASRQGARDRSHHLRRLDPRQRQALKLFKNSETITSHQIETLFGISQRAARNLLVAWVDDSFLRIVDPAKKSRKYGLTDEFEEWFP
jgi:Fic family protein